MFTPWWLSYKDRKMLEILNVDVLLYYNCERKIVHLIGFWNILTHVNLLTEGDMYHHPQFTTNKMEININC
jgi:hypothetical protein